MSIISKPDLENIGYFVGGPILGAVIMNELIGRPIAVLTAGAYGLLPLAGVVAALAAGRFSTNKETGYKLEFAAEVIVPIALSLLFGATFVQAIVLLAPGIILQQSQVQGYKALGRV